MCFGNNTQDTTKTTNQSSSYTPAPYLTAAAQSNLNFAQNLQSQGFQPYGGQMVADFSPQQSASFGMGSGIAGAVTPNIQLAGTGLSDYLGNTANPNTPITPSTIASKMSPYMNQYVSLALQPQLAQAANAYMLQSQAQQGAATSAGAFGDPRANLLQSNLGLNYAMENAGLVGNAYTSAFNTAIGAGAQDVSNDINAQVASGNLRVANLGAQLAGVNTGFNQGVGGANLINTYGGQQTAQSQADLNAKYNQYLMALGYPFQTTGLVNQTIGAAVPASPSTGTSSGTSVTSTPDNSGFGLLGALGGGLFQGIGNAGGVAAFFADGGRPMPGQPAVVGERGPELFVPDMPARPNGWGAALGADFSHMTPAGGMPQTNPGLPMPIANPPAPPIQVVPGAGYDQATMPQQAPATENFLGANAPMAEGMPARAAGGPVQAGQPTLVGENGPEVVVPNQPGTVIPNHLLPKKMKKTKKPAGGLAAQLGVAA